MVSIVQGQKPTILAYGLGVEGDVAAVKRLVNAGNYFFDRTVYSRYGPNMSLLPPVITYIDDYDTLGISVADIMHNAENQQHYGKNTSGFAAVTRKILFDNTYELSVLPVKTLNTTSYGESTILRVKHVNSDYSKDYCDARGINGTPVIFAGGIFSHLESWEGDGKGLARIMANEGRDVWEIELTGGPDTDCPTCPNYQYGDLVDHYWPASIAGIAEYSGKSQFHYVGHSNGCRAALSSLNAYSNSGKASAGAYFDWQTGQYLSADLPAHAIDRFVGVACPGTLNGTSLFTFVAGLPTITGEANGDHAMRRLNVSKHVRFGSYVSWLLIPDLPLLTKDDRARLIILAGAYGYDAITDGRQISYNLMSMYSSAAVRGQTFDVAAVNVTAAYFFAATPDDWIVPYRDVNATYEALNVQNKSLYPYVLLNSDDPLAAIHYMHANLPDQDDVIQKIRDVLR
jgi:pimeloyl-ACP methyl ester carboxylesterase